MGFADFFQELFKNAKDPFALNPEQLGELSDEELLEALWDRVLAEEEEMEMEEFLTSCGKAKRVFYVIYYFDMEVQNGGLCQYFVNSSRETAPYVSDCLKTIGAEEFDRLLGRFVEANRIDLRDLHSFAVRSVKEFEAQTKRYPFDDFDDAYYALYEKKPLDKQLVQYVRLHLEEF